MGNVRRYGRLWIWLGWVNCGHSKLNLGWSGRPEIWVEALLDAASDHVEMWPDACKCCQATLDGRWICRSHAYQFDYMDIHSISIMITIQIALCLTFL